MKSFDFDELITTIVITGLVVFVIIAGFGAYKDSKRVVDTDTIVDVRYNEAYTKTETDTKYEYNWHTGEYELVPYFKTTYVPESYELMHEISYEGGKVKREWRTCTRKEYENAKLELNLE